MVYRNIIPYGRLFLLLCQHIQTFTDSKTENGIRKVPIADKVLPFYKEWFDSAPSCEYLLHTEENKQFLYRNYYDSYFTPLMQNLDIEKTPHCCRHTCISMLAAARIDQTMIKKIVGHSGAMTLTEKSMPTLMYRN